MLGFVGDERGEGEIGETVAVAGECAVGRDDDVEGFEVRVVGETLGTVVDEDAQVRSEAGGFAPPVFDEGRGADDEGGEA